jgi:hypothetical protein
MFTKILILIAIISFLMALNSLRHENTKSDLKKAKYKLSKGRVIFQNKD